MLDKPGIDVLQSLVRLEHDNDFKRMMSWLEDSLDKTRKTGDKIPDEVLLRMNQGSSQTLDSIIETVRTARQRITPKVARKA